MILRYFSWKTLLIILACVIAFISLYYAHVLTKKLAAEERKKIVILAKAIENVASTQSNFDITFPNEIIQSNTTIPLILVGNNQIQDSWNIDPQKASDKKYLERKIESFKKINTPIEVKISEDYRQYVYYGESNLLVQLRYFPYILLCILFLFIALVIFLFSTANKHLQDKVWVGMSKETAHQLGTPLSSLEGWLQHLQDGEISKNISTEMQKDVDRLKLIADRFSKIGSKATLENGNLITHIQSIISYMQKRSSQKIKFNINYQNPTLNLKINGPLLDWVFENLIRNALDSMEENGKIDIQIIEKNNTAIIDISDTGKGISARNSSKIFKPGFSTKKRGWGLGLSLSKRIIEEYHKGQIYLKNTEQGKGTTFRIILKK